MVEVYEEFVDSRVPETEPRLIRRFERLSVIGRDTTSDNIFAYAPLLVAKIIRVHGIFGYYLG